MQTFSVKSPDTMWMWKSAQREALLPSEPPRAREAGEPGAGGLSQRSSPRDGFEEARRPAAARGSVRLEPKKGGDVYKDIEKLFGKNSVEVPDRGPSDRHIKVVEDRRVGTAFEFRLNRERDKDPLGHPDRQRCEIKVGPHAPDRLKATKGESFTYKWRFKLDDPMQVSRSFTHFFQLKGAGGNDSMPLVTLSGQKTGDGDKLQVRYSKDGGRGEVLSEHDLSSVRGKWLEATVTVDHSKNGKLKMDVRTLDGNKPVLSVNRSNIDMIRDCDFVRPKWGFYRSLSDKENLKPGDTTVRFADFTVTPHGKGGRPAGADGYEPDRPSRPRPGGKDPVDGGSSDARHPSASKFPSGVLDKLGKQTGIKNPEVWDNILKLTNKSEQDNLRWQDYYNYAEALDYDSHKRGLTVSIWGFTTKHGKQDGDAIPLFREYEALGGKVDLLRLKDNDAALKKAIKGLDDDPIWKKAVWQRFSKTYIADTMKALRERGFSNPSPLTVAALLDCALNQGSTGNKGMFWCVDKVPSHIKNEKKFLAEFLDVREKVAGTDQFNSPPINGKRRVNQYRELLERGATSLVNSDALIKDVTSWVMR
jgi:hypothetical protein